MTEDRASGPQTHAQSTRERRDAVSGEVMPEARLIRFVAGPDGAVVPDLGRKLPGRGVWVEATREAVAAAVKKNSFARSAKAPLKPAPDLADQVEQLLVRRCLEQLGLARREGALISGFEKTSAAIRSAKAAWWIEASDGAMDGRRKLFAVRAKSPQPDLPVCGAFSAHELGVSTGGETVIHVALLAGRRAGRWTEEVRRLAGFRRIVPQDWPV
ncbi:MAG: RNA-binding protein [Proteobacteria bacterium]|nr:RNA-binding protein [Pseudomonadota bacterium]